MPTSERPTFVDRVVERVFYPNINGITPGPLAGRAEQRRLQKEVNSSRDGIDGFAGIDVLPSRKAAILTLAITAGLGILAGKTMIGKITKK